MNKQFSVKETIIYSVHSLLAHPWYFIKLFIYWFLFSLVIVLPLFGLISVISIFGTLANASFFGGIIFFVALAIAILLIYLLAMAYIWWAPTKLLLHWYDTKSEAIFFTDFFKLFSVSQLFRLIGVLLLYGTIVALGLILFIVPGIYLMVKLQFALFYVIDENISVGQAFKKSYAATTGNFWRILCVDVIAALLMQLIITIPISCLMNVYTYRKLG